MSGRNKKISIRPFLFLYYEESLVSSNLNSKLFRFHCVRPNAHTFFAFQKCIESGQLNVFSRTPWHLKSVLGSRQNCTVVSKGFEIQICISKYSIHKWFWHNLGWLESVIHTTNCISSNKNPTLNHFLKKSFLLWFLSYFD